MLQHSLADLVLEQTGAGLPKQAPVGLFRPRRSAYPRSAYPLGAFNAAVQDANGGSPYFDFRSKFKSFVPFLTSTCSIDLSEYCAGTPLNSTATTRLPTGTRSTLYPPSLTFAPTNWSAPMKKKILPAARGLPFTVILPRTGAVAS